MNRWLFGLAALYVALTGASASAQTAAEAAQTAPADPAAAAPAQTTVRIPADTVVQVELTESLSSRTSHQEQTFGLRLAEPIIVDGREVVPAGATGGGEVIDAAHAAFGGRQGRLIVSGRYIEIAGQHARIHGMQITATGENRSNTALAMSMIPYAGVAAIFMHGGEIEIPAGARGTARLAADVDVPIGAAVAEEAPAEPAQPVQSQAQGENQQ